MQYDIVIHGIIKVADGKTQSDVSKDLYDAILNKLTTNGEIGIMFVGIKNPSVEFVEHLINLSNDMETNDRDTMKEGISILQTILNIRKNPHQSN